MKFPQSLFSVFVTDLPAEISIREFAFWLANRARFSSADATGAENFDLLLVIEAKTGNAALTVGYGLEKFISEDDLSVALTAARPALRRGKLERGIRLCVEEMTRLLTDICKADGRCPENAARTDRRRKLVKGMLILRLAFLLAILALSSPHGFAQGGTPVFQRRYIPPPAETPRRRTCRKANQFRKVG